MQYRVRFITTGEESQTKRTFEAPTHTQVVARLRDGGPFGPNSPNTPVDVYMRHVADRVWEDSGKKIRYTDPAEFLRDLDRSGYGKLSEEMVDDFI
jgi:hypothetical protein